jgi:protein-S-isoprenylcysteine O-methyltransferase Ste14
MLNTVRLTPCSILINGVYYALTAVLGPALVLWAEAAVGQRRQAPVGLRVSAVVLTAGGVVLQACCIVLFQRLGRGTPSPALPTRRLVAQGPYRWVRNPLNLGELLVFLALAGWFASVGLLIYTCLAWIAFQAFIVLREEPRHVRAFGAAYRGY